MLSGLAEDVSCQLCFAKTSGVQVVWWAKRLCIFTWAMECRQYGGPRDSASPPGPILVKVCKMFIPNYSFVLILLLFTGKVIFASDAMAIGNRTIGRSTSSLVNQWFSIIVSQPPPIFYRNGKLIRINYPKHGSFS